MERRIGRQRLVILTLCLLPTVRYAAARDDTVVSHSVWPDRAVATALSYIRMLPEDLSLRTDYVRRDTFRLHLVDRVMTNPTEMPTLMVQIATTLLVPDTTATIGSADGFPSIGVAAVANLALDVPASGQWTRFADPDVVSRLSQVAVSPPWREFLTDALAAMSDTSWADSVLRALTPSEREIITTLAPELVVEDEADRDKPAEVLDSLQKLEDSLAARIARIADRIDWRWGVARGVTIVSRLLGDLPDTIPTENRRTAAQMTVAVVDTKIGRIAIGTTGPDQFAGDYAIIIDPGGDDIYRLDPCPLGRHRLIIDWDGNDTYIALSGRDLGSGYWGWGLLVDRAGDDTYRAGSFSLGSGWFGVGVLIDGGGRDIYSGDTYTQGAGGFGVGILCDRGGESDDYTARLHSQGFGFTAGLGILADDGGNDQYSAGGKYEDVLRYRDHYVSLSQGFGYGVRPHFSGGIGILYDGHGNDTYLADIFGQGSSYWWAFGGLYDGGGNDHYIAHQYAQGAATHMTAGCLFDGGGDDSYAAAGVSQGCGHDWAAGLLVDAAGNDRYSAVDLSQGAGSANGVGMLVDESGDDVYTVRSRANTQGYGNPRREYGSIGVFLDLSGADRYDGPGRESAIWLSRSLWGVGVDVDSAWSGFAPK